MHWEKNYVVITCMINYFWSILMRWYFFTYIVVINYFIVDTNNWLCIIFFLKIHECIKGNFGMNVDTRKFWISYNIINIWCIRIIWSATVDVWVYIITSPLLRLGQKLTDIFSSWKCKLHHYLFYFCKIFLQYNKDKTLKLRRCSMPWASRVDLSREKCNDQLNCI